MTPQEAKLWQEVRGNRINGLHIRRQQVIGGLIADFYCNDTGLVIEIDGPIHLEHREYDARRHDVFHARGLKVLHFTNEDIDLRLAEVLGRIRQICHTRYYPNPGPQDPPLSGKERGRG